ncbi:MAG TPA: hypothetical protein VFJ02_09055 [Vicinamibacterales bacterium]|nr:hypothetical protein [Vicinamibacterales bacterium]
MNRRLAAWGAAYALACSTAIAAQDPQTQSPRPSASPATAETVTVEGCLLREADVPGRTPPEAERERVRADDDYVLSDAKMIKGTAPAPMTASGAVAGTSGTTAAGTTGATTSSTTAADPKPTGSSGALVASPSMFDVEQIDKEQLTQYRGKRVQIEGVFKHPELAANPTSPATDLVELHGTAIRVVAGGECPSAK